MRGMLSELIVIHRRRGKGQPGARMGVGLEWETCLRRVAFLHRGERAWSASGEEEGYAGVEAYQFVLEVICGLHSPLVGETEVMGQFREFSGRAAYPGTAWGRFLRQFMADVLKDARRVRSGYLRGMGSQTYGSLARRYLRPLPEIVVLGAGQLAREMMPWLAGGARVTVVNRSRRGAEALREAHPGIEIAGLGEESACASAEAGLVIAAPLQAREILEWAGRQRARFVRTLDLRGDSAADPVALSGEGLNLDEFFRLFDEERRRVRRAAGEALAEIRRLAMERRQSAPSTQCRPHGWEDLCA